MLGLWDFVKSQYVSESSSLLMYCDVEICSGVACKWWIFRVEHGNCGFWVLDLGLDFILSSVQRVFG